ASKVGMKTADFLTTVFSGQFFIRGSQAPYSLTGKCRISQANLTRLDASGPVPSDDKPVFNFDVSCERRDKLLVNADVMDAEFRGSFRLLGNNVRVGVLGNAEAIRGSVLFRETKFNLSAGTVKFESPSAIAPRFNVSGRAQVKEQKTTNP